MIIGICDDNAKDREYIKTLCDMYFGGNEDGEYVFFNQGEEVIEYVENEKNSRIDLLFLDIEMGEISGITVKDMVVKSDKIWRLVFVTGVDQKDVDAFGLKVIGYIQKPATQERVNLYLNNVVEDIRKERYFPVDKIAKNLPKDILVEDILYFQSDGSYTKIHTKRSDIREIIVTKKFKQVEELLIGYPFIRVHKSYIVNMMNIETIETKIGLKDVKVNIPVGRTYLKTTNDTYNEYVKNKIRKIL